MMILPWVEEVMKTSCIISSTTFLTGSSYILSTEALSLNDCRTKR